MSEPTHSPLPHLHSQPGSSIIWSDKSEIVAECGGSNFTEEESAEHARLIVSAVNSHTKLLAAAKLALRYCGPIYGAPMLGQVRTALEYAINGVEPVT